MPNEHELRFGYERQIGSSPGMWLQTGQESTYLTDKAGGMFPITVGDFDYVIGGYKGHIVNWMIEHGDQIVQASQHRGRRTVHFVLRDAANSVGESIQDALFGLALSAIGGPVKEVLHRAHQAHGAYVGASDFVQGTRSGEQTFGVTSVFTGETGNLLNIPKGTAAGGPPQHFRFPGLTARKVLRLTTVVSSADEKFASKNLDTNRTRTNFSTIAAWMFGS